MTTKTQMSGNGISILLSILGIVGWFLSALEKEQHLAPKNGYSFLNGIINGWKPIDEIWVKISPIIFHNLRPYFAHIWEYLLFGILVLSFVFYEWLKEDDTFPFKMTINGMIWGVSGLLELPLLFDYLKLSLHNFHGFPFFLVDVIISTSPLAILVLMTGAPLWAFLEFRGRKWTIDESGRRFPQIWSGKRGSLYKVEPKEVRFKNELNYLIARRRIMIIEGLIMGGLVFAIIKYSGYYLSLYYVMIFIFTSLLLLGNVITEIAYQLGAEFIPGALVKDQDPVVPNINRLGNERIHGFVDLSSNDESNQSLGNVR